MVAKTPQDSAKFIAYFEEPEQGVPHGCTGWFHSYGQFELKRAEQAFETKCNDQARTVRHGIAGPFTAFEAARQHLLANMN